MDIKDFIMESVNYKGKFKTIPINDKYNLVSDGEGGNRHLFVVRGEYNPYRSYHYDAFVYHIWIDMHGILWATLYSGNQKNKKMSDIVNFCFAKNSVDCRGKVNKTYEFSDFSQVEKAIKDILLYAKN